MTTPAMLKKEQIQAEVGKLVATFKTADSQSQHVVASACARSIQDNNGTYINSVLEAVYAVNKKHGEMAYEFAKANFPFASFTYTSTATLLPFRGFKYSKKRHLAAPFLEASYEVLYERAMNAAYIVEKEKKPQNKKTDVEKHDAALEIIAKMEKIHPELIEHRHSMLKDSISAAAKRTPTVDEIIHVIQNTNDKALIMRLMAAANTALTASKIAA